MAFTFVKSQTYLGLAREHTTEQSKAWVTRTVKEAKCNTRLHSAVQAAAQTAWQADILLATKRHNGPVPHALPAGTGGGAIVPARAPAEQQAARTRRAHTAGGGFRPAHLRRPANRRLPGDGASLGAFKRRHTPALPGSAQEGHQAAAGAPTEAEAEAEAEAEEARRTKAEAAVRLIGAARARSAGARLGEATAASRARAECGRERASDASDREAARARRAGGVTQLPLHQHPAPLVHPRLFHGEPERAERASARREALAARHRARDECQRASASEAQRRTAAAAEERLQAEERRRVAVTLQAAARSAEQEDHRTGMVHGTYRRGVRTAGARSVRHTAASGQPSASGEAH